MSAQVQEIVVLSRRDDEPMQSRLTIRLGTGELHWHHDSDTSPPRLGDSRRTE
ncbi:hypothetical protein WKI68_43730 [Streptomyces sp. MS1.HAVA.3]|uniref:Uncharacterized protein n=1 Tax=Streptomyces caledonius TaxID=3134107 RepID=A0ABU8UEH3_9ACTN